MTVTGDGGLDAAQVFRFLSLDVDARTWPDVGTRDPSSPTPNRSCPGCGLAIPLPLRRSFHELQSIKGIGPFAAELIVLRGANAPTRYP